MKKNLDSHSTKWLARKNGKSVYIPIASRFSFPDQHLKKAYWWACKRYTSYHNICIRQHQFDADDYYRPDSLSLATIPKRDKLFRMLRELEYEATRRGIDLPTPDIRLIHNDKKVYQTV